MIFLVTHRHCENHCGVCHKQLLCKIITTRINFHFVNVLFSTVQVREGVKWCKIFYKYHVMKMFQHIGMFLGLLLFVPTTSFLPGFEFECQSFLVLKCGRLLFKWKYLGTSLRLNCLENTSKTFAKQPKHGKQLMLPSLSNCLMPSRRI